MTTTISLFRVATLGLAPAELGLVDGACLLSQVKPPVFLSVPFNPAGDPHVVLVNSDDPDSVSRWRSICADRPHCARTPVIWLGAADPGQRDGHRLRLPTNAGGLLAVLGMATKVVFDSGGVVAFPGSEESSAPDTTGLMADDVSGPGALVIGSDVMTRVQVNIALQGVVDRVDFCRTKRQAIECMQRYCYDVAFVDIAYMGIQGFEACDVLTEVARTRNTAMILLTSYVTPIDMAQGRRIGCDTYMIKPIRQSILKGVVRGFIRARMFRKKRALKWQSSPREFGTVRFRKGDLQATV